MGQNVLQFYGKHQKLSRDSKRSHFWNSKNSLQNISTSQIDRCNTKIALKES